MAKPKWTHASVIEAIQCMLIPSPKAAKKIPGLYPSAIRLYGSWRKAVEASGLVYSEVGTRRPAGYWTKEQVIRMIRITPGLHSAKVRRENPALYSAAMRCFGSWKKAIEGAGFDYDSIHQTWTEETAHRFRYRKNARSKQR